MTGATISSIEPFLAARRRAWSEDVWLERLDQAVGRERMEASPIAACLPAMLVALGWIGTVRSLAALLPPPGEPMVAQDLDLLLDALGFRWRRIPVTGARDTTRLRVGSLAFAQDGSVAVFLGRPDEEDRWLAPGNDAGFTLRAGDELLSIAPDLDHHPAETPQPHWFRSLFEATRNELFKLVTVSFAINLLALSVSIYTMVVYSDIIPSGTTGTIWGIALLALAAVLGGWALRVGRLVAVARIGGWAGVRIASGAMRKMMALPLEATTRLGLQNNVIRLRSFETARQFLSGAGGQNLIDYPFVVIFLVVIALMGGWLVVVPLIALGVYLGLALPMADYLNAQSTAAGVAARRLEEQAGAAFLGIEAFHRAGAGSHWMIRFSDLARAAAERNRDYAIAVARVQAMGQAISMFTVLATMCVGILLVLDGIMEAGGLVATMMLIWRITTPAQQAFGSLVRLRQIRSTVRQVDQLMLQTGEKTGTEFTSPLGLLAPTLAAERLYYRPDAEREAALNGVSFNIAPGKRIAVVGPNGCGKSALLECIAGLRQPQSGRLLIAGRDMRQFDAVEYRAWIGYVPQSVPALPLDVLDYLRLRAPTLTEAEALAAFERVVGADWPTLQVLGPLPERILSRRLKPFDETHAEQQFRHIVATVAASLGDPQVLLLDGEGAGGDPEWEARLVRYLDSIRGRTTVVWVPHAVSNIRSCDELIILERGNLLHAGPPGPVAADAG